jgi:hypothetical protein
MKKVCSWKTVGFCFLVFTITLIADIKLSHAQESEQLKKALAALTEEMILHPEKAESMKEFYWTYLIPSLLQEENAKLPQRIGDGVVLFNVKQLNTVLVWSFLTPVDTVIPKDTLIKDICTSASARFLLSWMGGAYVYRYYYEGHEDPHTILYTNEKKCKGYSV